MSLDFKVVEGAQAAPMQRDPRRPHRLLTRFSLPDAQGRALRDWPLLTSLDTTFPVNRRLPSPAEAHVPSAIYGGFLCDTFGHTLTESIVDLAAVAELAAARPALPILCHIEPRMGAAPQKMPQEKGFFPFFLRKLGLDYARLRFITAPMTVGELLIAPSPFRRKARYQPHSAALLDRYFGLPGQGPEKIYFSRSRWTASRLVDEPSIEAQVREHGYEVVHPQELSLEDQLRMIRGARALVGPQGTALHWSLYSGSLRQVISLGWASGLQKGICALRQQQYVEISGRRPRGEALRVRAVSPSQLERFLQE